MSVDRLFSIIPLPCLPVDERGAKRGHRALWVAAHQHGEVPRRGAGPSMYMQVVKVGHLMAWAGGSRSPTSTGTRVCTVDSEQNGMFGLLAGFVRFNPASAVPDPKTWHRAIKAWMARHGVTKLLNFIIDHNCCPRCKARHQITSVPFSELTFVEREWFTRVRNSGQLQRVCP